MRKAKALYLLLPIGLMLQTTLAWSATELKPLTVEPAPMPIGPALEKVVPPTPVPLAPPETNIVPAPIQPLEPPSTKKESKSSSSGQNTSPRWAPNIKCFKLLCCHTENGIVCHPERPNPHNPKGITKN